jgi:hypothetical protein
MIVATSTVTPKTKTARKTCINKESCKNAKGARQPLTNFHRYSRSTDGHKSECKSCRLTYQKSYDTLRSYDRSVKGKVYNLFPADLPDARREAFNYLAKELGIKVKVRVEYPSWYSKSMRATERRYTIKDVNTAFTTREAKVIAFNLLSYQLDQTARA